jgi:hypothetical protein
MEGYRIRAHDWNMPLPVEHQCRDAFGGCGKVQWNIGLRLGRGGGFSIVPGAVTCTRGRGMTVVH